VRLRTILLGALAYVLLLAIIAFGVPLGLTLSARVNDEVRSDARAQAIFVALSAADLLAPTDRAQLLTLAAHAGNSLRGRVIIVDRSGVVLVDSAGPAQRGESYLSRPEIQRALGGRQVQLQRDSRTLGREILATAVPIIHDGRVAGAVRVTQSVAAVHQAVRQIELELILIGLVVLGVGLLAAAVLASRIGRPLKGLEATARRVAQGDLSARAKVEGSLEQRSLAMSFNEMTDRIARLLSAQREFVADASHKLRTPLTGLRLRLEEASALTTTPDATTELDAAIGEVDRLAHTVDELLVLSRGGERQLVGAPVDLDDLLDAAGERWRHRAAEQRVSIVVRHDGRSGTVWAARADLERALDALLENALCYSPAGGTVTVVGLPARIEVRDQGPGIAEDERDLVFERFYRGRAGVEGPPGSGLGLPIARELTRGWGGEVTLTARDGGGLVAALRFEAPAGPGHQRGERFARA
jgi:two-component system, OmpR family, sensor kinase